MTEDQIFEPWNLEWEEAHIKRFWNWYGNNPSFESLYFSRLYGRSILNRVKRHINLGTFVVDFGSGPGYFVDLLTQEKVPTIAIDSSHAAITNLKMRLSSTKCFLGAKVSTTDKIPLNKNTASTVFMIEVIEHLDDEALSKVMLEIHRIIQPGGYVVVTTPNEENLELLKTLCPNCGCKFHTMQHLRSYSVDIVEELMSAFQFESVHCQNTLFSRFNNPIGLFQRLAYFIAQEPLPHLLFIGKKT